MIRFICHVVHLFSIRDELFNNLGDPTVLECKMFRLLSPFPKRDVLKEGAQGSKYPGRHKNLFLKVEENAQRFQINGRGRKKKPLMVARFHA